MMRNLFRGLKMRLPQAWRVRKVWIIMRHEILDQLMRVSFWVGVLLPLLGYLLYGGAELLNRSEAVAGNEEAAPKFTPQDIFQPFQEKKPLGYIDLSGLIRQFPDTLEPGAVIPFENELLARTAMINDEIRGYYVVEAEFINGAPLRYYTGEPRLTGMIIVDPAFREVLDFNLLDGNSTLFRRIWKPVVSTDETILVPENASTYRSEDMNSIIIPTYLVLFFMSTILGFSSLLLNSFNREIETRVMEVLLCSTNAREIMWGKFSAYWVIGLVSILFWMINLLILNVLSGDILSSLDFMNISASFILWATVFGLLGFIFYSTLMMGLGTLVPYLRQLSRVTQYLMFPVMAPTIFAPILAEDPNGAFAIILSFFPLTAPTAVTLRLLFANVPIWQLLLSCLVMVVSTVVGINLISRYYQPYHLLYQPHVKIIDDLRSLVKRLSFRRKPESLRGMD